MMGRGGAHARPTAIAAVALFLLAAAPAAAATPEWWSYDRGAEYSTVTSKVFVTVSDGTPIHCVLAQPGKDGARVAGKFPALMSEYTPYGAMAALSAGSGESYWADRGYVTLTCDVRGTGQSGGVWQGLLSDRENRDNLEILAWMRDQPWSNGRLGQLGVSYGGMTSMRVASLQPPGLLAIAPTVAQDDLYREDIYPGGIKSTPVTGDVWPAITVASSGGRELAAVTYGQYLEHPTWDDYWQQISMWTKWERVKVPVLAIGAWNDTLVPGGPMMNWVGLNRAGHPHNYLIAGPWGHGAAPAADLPPGATLAWFDHWLMQLPGAPLPTERVASFEQPRKGAGRGWESLTSWPPATSRTVEWKLRGDGKIARTPGTAGTLAYTTLPQDQGDSGLNDSGAIPPGERPDQTLVFDTDTLESDLPIAGRIVVHLRASLSHSDGNFKAVAYDVAPTGTMTFINEGYLKASHRLSHEQPELVAPDTMLDYNIELFPMHWRFAKGHKLRLRIYGGHATELVPQDQPVTTTVAVGEGGSTVTLPQADGQAGSGPGQPQGIICRRLLRTSVRAVVGARRARRLARAVVYVNGKRVRTLRGRLVHRGIVVRKLKGTKVRVRVVGRTRAGRVVRVQRTYRLCSKA